MQLSILLFSIIVIVLKSVACVSSDFSNNVCDVSTNLGCKNGGVCAGDGFQRTRCLCSPGLTQPYCDYPGMQEEMPDDDDDLNPCNGYCPVGQQCVFSDDGHSYCTNSSAVLNQTSNCPLENNPCGDAPCSVSNNLIICLNPITPTIHESPTSTTTKSVRAQANSVFYCPIYLCNGFPCLMVNGVRECFCPVGTPGPNCMLAIGPTTSTSTTTTQTTTVIYAMCPVSPCLNDSPCVMINSVPTCFCVPGTSPPYCGTNLPVTTPAGFTSCSNYSLCYGASPCLSINGINTCFCMPGTIPPYCMPAPVANTTTTTTTTSSRLPTTTTSSTTTFMVMAANCPVNNLCNGSPCIEINGEEQCFCNSGTIPPYCLPTPVPTTSKSTTTKSPPIGYSYCSPGSPLCGGNNCVFIDDILNCCDPIMPPPDSFCLVGGMPIPLPSNPNPPPPSPSPPPPSPSPPPTSPSPPPTPPPG